MSSEAVGWVYRHSPFSGVDFAVHAAVADSANDQNDYRLWMSMDTLARKARVSRASATRAVTKLVDAGYLERIDEPGIAKREGRTARYVFLFPDDAEVIFETRRKGGSTGATPPAHHDSPGGSPSATPVAHGEPQTQENPNEPKRSRRKRRTPPPEDFAPNDTHRELASSLRLDIDAERREFIDGAHAHGRIYADHDRAFTQWLRRAPAFGPAKPLLDLEPASGPTYTDVEQHVRDLGPYACPLELGCDNGWHDSEAGVVRCPCLTKASA